MLLELQHTKFQLCNLVVAICNYFQHRALKEGKLIFSIENIISKLMFTVGCIIFYEIKKISNFIQCLSEAVDIPLAILIFLPIIIFHSTIIFPPVIIFVLIIIYLPLYLSPLLY